MKRCGICGGGPEGKKGRKDPYHGWLCDQCSYLVFHVRHGYGRKVPLTGREMALAREGKLTPETISAQTGQRVKDAGVPSWQIENEQGVVT